MKQYFLTAAERRHLEYVRSRAVCGLYRIKDLLGEAIWASIEAKTSYGIRAKRSVEAGQIPGITLYGKTVENHQLYCVSQAAA